MCVSIGPNDPYAVTGGIKMALGARHIWLSFSRADALPPDWLNQFWQRLDWLAVESLGEQVFGLIALTAASVRR